MDHQYSIITFARRPVSNVEGISTGSFLFSLSLIITLDKRKRKKEKEKEKKRRETKGESDC